MKPYYETELGRLFIGNVSDIIPQLPDESVQCIITSPPYWGLRDYGHDGQIGLERTPEEYIEKVARVFRECRRALRDDGTLWLNIGDSYAASRSYQVTDNKHPGLQEQRNLANSRPPEGLKQKDLVGIPWMLAFALRADGWYLRQDIIWHKPNPMPESVTDRCTKAHEYLFLLSKNQKYFYDAEAVKEKNSSGAIERFGKNPMISVENRKHEKDISAKNNRAAKAKEFSTWLPNGRNKRSVWTVATYPFKEAHFATFPPKLIEPCILAGTRPGDTILDPFLGSGTTAVQAEKFGRKWIGIDLGYTAISVKRIESERKQLSPWSVVA